MESAGVTRSIFAIEMCLRYDPTFAAGARNLLCADTSQPSAGHLWHLWTAAADELRRRQSAWVSGCWDFWEDPTKAQTDFQMWKNGLMTEEGARKAPSAGGEPYRGGERFLTMTMACLLVKGSAAERAMAQACNVPQAYLWHTATFQRVLMAIRHINFAVVERATAYLIPKEDGWALTPEDLRDPKFHYLRPIV
jgi:hypothetical protein